MQGALRKSALRKSCFVQGALLEKQKSAGGLVLKMGLPVLSPIIASLTSCIFHAMEQPGL